MQIVRKCEIRWKHCMHKAVCNKHISAISPIPNYCEKNSDPLQSSSARYTNFTFQC